MPCMRSRNQRCRVGRRISRVVDTSLLLLLKKDVATHPSVLVHSRRVFPCDWIGAWTRCEQRKGAVS